MTGRVWIGAVVAALGLSVTVSAQTWSGRATGSNEGASLAGATVTPGRTSAATVQTMLGKRVESVEWEEITFEEVIDWLRDQGEGRVNIVPRWNALSLEDVDRDKFVTLQLSNSNVRQVLNEVVDQLSETGEVTYRGQGNTLKISTKTDFNRKLELRVYDVTDILFRVPDFSETAPEIDLSEQTGGARGSTSGQSVFSNSSGDSSEELSEEGDQDPEEILEDLTELIQSVVEPESWSEGPIGGGRGVIKGFNKRYLIVLNTVDVHEQIAGFVEGGL
jgi:hypothetical protein